MKGVALKSSVRPSASDAAAKGAKRGTTSAARKVAPETAKDAPPRRKRLTRAELAGESREKIFEAAAAVVGEHGYADASISKITEKAGIAQGTFYLYFASRQALFDELLPHIGQDMITYIGHAIHNANNVYEVEEKGFRAFFAYLQQSPGFFQILNQAETWSPKAHARHLKLLTQHYVASLKRSVDRGEVKAFDEKELEVMAYVFMGARSYLYMRYLKGAKSGAKLPQWVVNAYMKLVRDGFR